MEANGTARTRRITRALYRPLSVVGSPDASRSRPDGRWYTFEAGASKATGGDGWADVWKRGCFAWEYKGKHANLDKAYGQLLNYSGSLENPPLLIVSDIERILIHTHFTNTVKKSYLLTLDDLLDPSKLDLLRKAFTQPDALRSPETTTQVTELARPNLRASHRSCDTMVTSRKPWRTS